MLINCYKYKNNELLINYESTNISNILLQITKDFALAPNKKEIIFNYDNEAPSIIADKVWITKALQIIISILAELSYKQEKIMCLIKNQDNNIKLEFQYKGHSLTDNELKDMFSGNTNYTAVGLGIKMHLLKSLLDLHSGKIKILKCNTNNIFTITLPANKHLCRKTKFIKELQPFRL